MNNRGIALMLSYMVIIILMTLGSVFTIRSASEGKSARTYANSTKAFWIAEAGLSQAYYNWSNTIAQPSGAVSFAGGSYTINTSALPAVTVTANYAGSARAIRANFVGIPVPFENTLSCGGDLSLLGILARVEIYGKTRISGQYSKSGWAQGWFEDKQEGVSQAQTTIRIPDNNNNGTQDEFADFVLFGRGVVASYPPEEVIYVPTDSTVNIFPNPNYIGKKVIFVEGSAPGNGDVNIFFDATWQNGEDLTIISTGDISYIEPLQFQGDARLSTVSWQDYSEVSVFRSEHESVIYSHDDAVFVDILDWGSTTGNIIINDDISLIEVLSYEKYYYSDRALNGDLPPGFQLLPGSGGASSMLSDWQETQ